MHVIINSTGTISSQCNQLKTEQRPETKKIPRLSLQKTQSKAGACLPWGTKNLHISLPESDRSKTVESNSEKLEPSYIQKEYHKTSQSEPSACYHQFKGHHFITMQSIKKRTKRPQTKKFPCLSLQKTQSKAGACLPWDTKNLHISLPESDRSKPVESNSEKLEPSCIQKEYHKTSQSEPSACYHQFKGHHFITVQSTKKWN